MIIHDENSSVLIKEIQVVHRKICEYCPYTMVVLQKTADGIYGVNCVCACYYAFNNEEEFAAYCELLTDKYRTGGDVAYTDRSIPNYRKQSLV